MTKVVVVPLAAALVLAVHQPLLADAETVSTWGSPSVLGPDRHAVGGARLVLRIADRDGVDEVAISFAETAEFIVDESGDMSLEFTPICEMVWSVVAQRDECTYPDRYVRYVNAENWTEGKGILFGFGDDGSVWTIDLSQINWPGGTYLADQDLGLLIAEEVGGAHRRGMANFSW